MANKGQSKMHLVRDAQGNQFEMSQEDWRNRDKSAGLTRVDEAEQVVTEEAAPAEGAAEGSEI